MEHFIEEFAHLASDPAHLAFEVVSTIVIEGILLGLLWPLVKRHIHRDIRVEHAKIEEEHGLVHPMSFAEASRIEREADVILTARDQAARERERDHDEWERRQIMKSSPYDYEKSGS